MLKISQPAVSKIEKQTDMYLSTLHSYVEAVGGEMDIVIRLPNRGPVKVKLASLSHVRLAVFNLLGQRVAMLVDDEQVAGSYRAQWDGTDATGRAVAAGVYVYRLTVGGASQTGRMVLVDGQAGAPMGGASVVVPTAEATSLAYGLAQRGLNAR